MSFSGIYPVVPTPFDEDGNLDVESIKKLIPLLIECGVDGITILGVMGEGHKLTDDGKALVIDTYRSNMPKTIDLIVGVRAAGTDAAIHAARRAEGYGADGLLVGPPFVQHDDVIYSYYKLIAQSVEIPMIIHDYPAQTGILMSSELITRIFKDNDNIPYIKLEDPPTGAKMDALKHMTDDKIQVFGALGGMYAFEELDRGAVGIMTGFAYPEFLVKLYNLFEKGKIDEAAHLFYDILPLIAFEFQPKIGISLRKHIFVQRGVFKTAKVRHPGPEANEKTIEHLHRIQDHLRAKGYDM